MSDRCENDLTILGFLHKMPSFLGSCAPFLVGNSLKKKNVEKVRNKKYIYIFFMGIKYIWRAFVFLSYIIIH